MRFFFLVICFSVSSVGCSGNPFSFNSNSESSIVIFSEYGSDPVDVVINDLYIGRVYSGEGIRVNRAPSDYVIRTKESSGFPLEISLTKSQVVYVSITHSDKGVVFKELINESQVNYLERIKIEDI